MTTTALVRQPPRKRRAFKRYKGLVPSYVGYNPVNFRHGEWKMKEVIIDGPINSTMTIYGINALSEGNSYNTRVGAKIAITSLELRWYSQAIPFTGTDQVHRVCCFADRQANGTLPAANSYLLNPTVTAFRNLNFRRRFKTIFDRTYVCNAAPEPYDTKYFHVYIKFRKPIIAEYNSGNTGTIADIITNSLIVGFIGNKTDTLAGNLYGNCRIRYTDS